MRIFRLVIAAVLFSALVNSVNGQSTVNQNQEGYIFKEKISLQATSVKDQHRTGTCWSFSGLSLLESEMLRKNRPATDLSTMFIVYHTYLEKARKYVRMHGNTNFSAGGAFHDVTNMIRKYGIVPEEVYKGLNYGEDKHVHGELDQLLKNQVEAVIKNPNRKLSPVWMETVESTLISYLGEIPEKFEYQGKEYSPQSFAREYVGLDMDDYIEISSFTHHPFYSRFIIEIPDNWSWDEVYNVPLYELGEIVDFALESGYTVGWAADVSERGFMSGNKGIAVMPSKNPEDMTDAEITRWESLSDRQREDELYRLSGPVSEIDVSQEQRQLAFDNHQTTDDHGMHIIGLAADQNGNLFYKVKNSWGDYNLYEGYFYASKSYFNYKTLSIMLHKDAVPPHIRTKLNL
ncbi:MAG: aminopeptidase C [Bacteroidota bacterium]